VLWYLPDLLAERMGRCVGVPRIRKCHAGGGHQQLPQDKLLRELALGALGAVRQHRQQRKPFPQSGYRFLMGMPACRVFSHLGAIAGLQSRANAVWSKNWKSAYQQPLRSSQRRHFSLQDAHSITHTQR
jgi:hypothetical protein